MSRRTWYLILIAICTIGFWLFENFYTPSTYGNPDEDVSKAEIFPEELLPESTSKNIAVHSYYLLSYSEPHEQAEWVAYTLKKSHLTYDDRERPYFIEDPKVKSGSADWRNYKNSGYDRGHLCPAGDRRFSEYAYNETFYTSNISPQDREFNAGVWNRLEQKVRYWCKKYGELHVITGGVLEKGLYEIGEEDVDVPEYFYKIVSRKSGSELKVIAFLIPNEPSNDELKSFVVSVADIEKVTKIDFFEKLSIEVEEELENEVRQSEWKF